MYDLQREEEKWLYDRLRNAKSAAEHHDIEKALERFYENVSELRRGRALIEQERLLEQELRKQPLTPTQKIDRKNSRRQAILDQRAKRGK